MPLWYIRLDRTRLGIWYKRLHFYEGTSRHKRPPIELKIREWKHSEWELFKKYHYLSSDLNKAGKVYVLEYNNESIGFCSIIHFPHPKNKKIKKVHRLVIRPDFQWLWIWIKFLEEVWNFYNDYDFTITTSNQALIFGLKKRSNWICYSWGKQSFTKSNKLWADYNRKMASFKLKQTEISDK